ncbi:hypothetical protein jhhlp_006911 [Lomentospora prolificans]|uniref:Gfd2/YDR514C-like C-terminal domain-containing protein n=1 Tax=Lomentospora prolificans TaxID=41688 RepID=A0A2N3N325_9PEZI|nr:hypothetical protein jhhlp_006911 [Lomentospora prolificans]
MPHMTDEEKEQWRPRIDFLRQISRVEFGVDQFLDAIQGGRETMAELWPNLAVSPSSSLEGSFGGYESDSAKGSTTEGNKNAEATSQLGAAGAEGNPAQGALQIGSNMARVDVASPSMSFCPWRMVHHYPDWFIGKSNGPRARPYFEKFYEYQEWDFSDARYATPFLFIPTEQFVAFLGTINAELGTSLKIPPGEHTKRFSITFRPGLPQPRYLGTIHDQESRELIRSKNLPSVDHGFFSESSSADVNELRWQLHDIASFGNNRAKGRSGEKQAVARDSRKRMMRNFQTFLGFRPGDLVAEPDAKFDVDDVPGFPPKLGPVLVSLDVEAHEVSHLPTEVGIIVLDTEKTKKVPPGKLGENWWPFAESTHLRVQEYASHTNFKYVQGCPDKFDFGTSRFVPMDDLRNAIKAILTSAASIPSPSVDGHSSDRDIIFVGHDFAQEERYLLAVGCDLSDKNAVMRADSRDLHQHVSGELQGRSLRHVLLDLGIDYAHLHNAGNDAVYSLRAAVACAVKDMLGHTKPPQKKVRREEGFVPGAPKLTEVDLEHRSV